MRKNINTTINEELYKEVRILAIKLGLNTNDLIEEGMRYILNKYKEKDINNQDEKGINT
ncbi:MAG TPA: hypothetical protein PK733_04155 [Clostridiales bacterium]|nr:hypothetical protein [Clostridiales bacterium]